MPCAYGSSTYSDEMAQYVQETKTDEGLLKVIRYVVNGWPVNTKHVDEKAQPYFQLKDQLTIAGGMFFSSDRIVVPTTEKGSTGVFTQWTPRN